jgi:hypothetical protein
MARKVLRCDRDQLLLDLAYGRGPGPVGYQLLTAAELSATGG